MLKRCLFSLALPALCALPASSPAAAETYIPANLTPVQLLEKADAAQGRLEPGNYSIAERTHGSTDTQIVTRIQGANRMTTERSGSFHTAYGIYNGQSWTQDENGIVRYTARVPKIARALAHPGDPNSGVQLLGLTQTEPQEFVLDVHPLDSNEQLRYFNARTFLLDRVVTKYVNGVTATTEYSDYRNVFGRMRPFKWAYSDGYPENAESGETLIFQRDADPISLAPPESYAMFTVPRGAPLELPARFDRGFITIPVTIGGQTLDFALDTGSSSLAIDPGALRRLGIASYGQAKERIGGDYDVQRSIVPALSVGALQMHNVELDVVPVDFESHVGLLGCDFFASGIVGIDIKAKRVTITAPDSFDPKALGLVPIPLKLDDCVPDVDASFDGVSGTFLLDTGAGGTILQPPFARKLHSAQPLSPGDRSRVGFIGGDVPGADYEIPNLRLGPILFRHAIAFVPSNRTSDYATDDGIIGRDVMQYYVIYFDYGTGTAYVKVNQ